MQDAVDAAPLRQHSNERSGGERLSAVRGRQQSNSGPLACGRYQNIEATCREARLDRHGTRVPVLRGQMPGAATLLFLVKDREGGKFSWRRRFTFLLPATSDLRRGSVCLRRSASLEGPRRCRDVPEPGSPGLRLHKSDRPADWLRCIGAGATDGRQGSLT